MKSQNGSRFKQIEINLFRRDIDVINMACFNKIPSIKSPLLRGNLGVCKC